VTAPDEVWLTHPNLTPGHDFKALRAAVGAWSKSGWRIREDQPELSAETPVVESSPEPAPDKPAPSPRFPKES
jgi:hypothetical protein